VIGDPTGLSLKFWGIGQNSALQVNIGGGGFVAPADLSVSGSLLFHALLTRETPINGYLGVGALAGINQGRRSDEAVFGIRFSGSLYPWVWSSYYLKFPLTFSWRFRQ